MTYTIDPITYFTERKLDFKPSHFIIANISISDTTLDEITEWIYNNFTGRFFIADVNHLISLSKLQQYKIGFEDPQEATYFTLRWS